MGLRQSVTHRSEGDQPRCGPLPNRLQRHVQFVDRRSRSAPINADSVRIDTPGRQRTLMYALAGTDDPAGLGSDKVPVRICTSPRQTDASREDWAHRGLGVYYLH